jgi:hypothetical protein
VAKVTFCLAHQAGQQFFIPKSFVGMTATSCGWFAARKRG